MVHHEEHRQHRVGWLRAAVLGANDGIVSTSSLVIGVASAGLASETVFLTACAGLVAGAISMAAGEYVSVCSQADTEKADLKIERRALSENYDEEVEELTQIYVSRGLEYPLANEVAMQLMRHDALGAHARDEIGISEVSHARPVQAALSSAASFTAGATLPVMLILLTPESVLIQSVALCSLALLSALGGLSAWLSGAKIYRGVVRIVFWGSFAMLATFLVGHLFGAVV